MTENTEKIIDEVKSVLMIDVKTDETADIAMSGNYDDIFGALFNGICLTFGALIEKVEESDKEAFFKELKLVLVDLIENNLTFDMFNTTDDEDEIDQ